MSRILGFAGIQMEVTPGRGNLDRMGRKLAQIKDRCPWVQLVLFSELCVFGNDPCWAQPIPGEATDRLCDMARHHNLWLVPGSLSESADGRVFNTAPVISPAGDLVTSYRKLYPWRPRERCAPGSRFCVFDLPPIGRLGLTICYDQWFPEVIRQLTWMGAEVILNPTMTTTADRELELTLARANAVTNQIYVASINGLGHGGNGRSILVDPEGRILAQADETESVLTARLDLDRVTQIREKGTLGQCQVLKSFRDGGHRFAVYEKDVAAGEGFRRLGPLVDAQDSLQAGGVRPGEGEGY
jgi:predicted amidohydrolase